MSGPIVAGQPASHKSGYPSTTCSNRVEMAGGVGPERVEEVIWVTACRFPGRLCSFAALTLQWIHALLSFHSCFVSFGRVLLGIVRGTGHVCDSMSVQ